MKLLPTLIAAVVKTIEDNSDAVTALDQAIGDGDHVINLQRGLGALEKQTEKLAELPWDLALQSVGMTLLSTMGGASGSLFGTLFLSMSKSAKGQDLDLKNFANAFTIGVDAVKKRGKADAGEKTMLDVLIPVEKALQQAVSDSVSYEKILTILGDTAITGVEATRNMIATKGRASFMAERSQGHIDAGAKTSQLMICAIVKILEKV
jgi:dihydroxyacetone kinase-like protein